MPTQLATIFVIDDDNSVRTAMQRLLRSARLEVRTFSSAEDFIDSGCMDQAGCLLLDVRMPGLTGLELQQIMRSHGCAMPIIFISAHDDDEARQCAIARGAVDFFTKPVDVPKILQTIHAAMGLPSSQAEGDRP